MEHKNPADRAHMWQYGNGSAPAPEPVVYDYAHQLPRHVHGPDGASKIVYTPEQCDAAFAEGYQLLPYPVVEADAASEPGDDSADAAADGADAPKKGGRKKKA